MTLSSTSILLFVDAHKPAIGAGRARLEAKMHLDLVSVIKSLVDKGRTEIDRRKFQRRKRVTFVTVQPLNKDLCPHGQPTWGMTRDFSKHGIGVITVDRLECDYVRFHIREDGFSAIGRIRHNRLVSSDDESPLYLAGIELLDEFNCHY